MRPISLQWAGSRLVSRAWISTKSRPDSRELPGREPGQQAPLGPDRQLSVRKLPASHPQVWQAQQIRAGAAAAAKKGTRASSVRNAVVRGRQRTPFGPAAVEPATKENSVLSAAGQSLQVSHSTSATSAAGSRRILITRRSSVRSAEIPLTMEI